MMDSIKQLWDIATKLLYVVAVVLLLIGSIELIRIYAFLLRVHPMLGYGYAVTAVIGCVWAFLYFRKAFGKLPRVLEPPTVGNLDEADYKPMVRFCKFQKEYLKRLGRNPNLGEGAQEHALTYIDRIDDVLGAHPLLDDLQRLIVEIDRDGIEPLLAALKAKATAEVRSSVRDIMITVTVSPYRMLDLLVVVYRNGSMILRVARIFDSRPTLRGQLRIINDTLKVVATVNILNLSRNLMESIFSNMPLVGRVVEDIGQGIGAGFFTDLAGHAAIARCSAYHGWDHEEAIQGLGSQSRRFLEDVRDIFIRDVLPQLRGRVRPEDVPFGEEVPDQNTMLDKLGNAVTSAFDATGYTLNQYMFKPAVAGTQSVFRAGTRIMKGSNKAPPQADAEYPPHGDIPPRPQERRRKRRGKPRRRKGLGKMFHRYGQRVKYSRMGHGK